METEDREAKQEETLGASYDDLVDPAAADIPRVGDDDKDKDKASKPAVQTGQEGTAQNDPKSHKAKDKA